MVLRIGDSRTQLYDDKKIWWEGVNSVERDKGRTESKVHENARRMGQKEARMGQQQVWRWME